MHNYKLTIAYDGTHYAGWQRQSRPSSIVHGPWTKTIQEAIETALYKIFQKRIHLEGSGRTDAGVHAIAQVAHFKTDKKMEPRKLQAALNGILPFDIVVTKVEEARLNFHARFDARSKIYRYIIASPKAKSAFIHSCVYWTKYPLDVPLMRREAKCLLGRHDFKAFQASDRIERSSVTTIKKITFKATEDSDYLPFLSDAKLTLIDIEAKGFLRNMVRNIVGTLIDIGRGKIKKGELKKILKMKDRRLAGVCAPARGLYLLEVSYA